MRKKRKNYTAQEKVAILKRHLVDQTPVSNLCDEYQLQCKKWDRGTFYFTPVNKKIFLK
ncbi:hypothetical protein [uncultured Desulfuromonas sp.]|uniref:hypothetical protein n=1 Tax=uncultured Desulfuromonas sp. TaxID=181013 RepID=UPI002AAB37EC|nr:hypothetical protein [uncultured Desulfuromonas sp.]